MGFNLGSFFDSLVNRFLVGFFFFCGGLGCCFLVDWWFLDLRVSNYFLVTLTSSAPGVWIRRGGIDVVTKKEGNC